MSTGSMCFIQQHHVVNIERLWISGDEAGVRTDPETSNDLTRFILDNRDQGFSKQYLLACILAVDPIAVLARSIEGGDIDPLVPS